MGDCFVLVIVVYWRIYLDCYVAHAVSSCLPGPSITMKGQD